VVLAQLRAGKMKALAVTDLKRSALAPEVPSVAELGYPQLESLAWIGLLAPAGTPSEILDRLSAETARGMHAADVRELRASRDLTSSRARRVNSRTGSGASPRNGRG
jgi:tripartite-type tricarboxylate transporter receptor subunit TctC